MKDQPTPSPAFDEAAQTAQLRAASFIGKVIAGRYRIHSIIAMGGVAAVFLGEHVHMRKRVAVKILHPDAENLPELVARFENESIVGAHIDHPNVASASDFGQLDDGTYYLVLEYVRGTTLHELIRQGPIPQERAVDIARQMATALDALHQRGILHRDLKPRNVMITDGARPIVKLIDFGFAKVPLDRISTVGGEIDRSRQPITGTGVIFGTVAYMAPEAALGMEAVTTRSDLYALGLILYEMLAGAHAFDATEQGALFLQQRTMTPPPIAQRGPGVEVAPALERVVMRLLEKSPSRRYESAVEVIAALDGAMSAADLPIDVAPPPPPSAASLSATATPAPGPRSAPGDGSESGRTSATSATSASGLKIAGVHPISRRNLIIGAAVVGVLALFLLARAISGSTDADEPAASGTAAQGSAPASSSDASPARAADRPGPSAAPVSSVARPTSIGGLDATAWRNKLRTAAGSKDWDAAVDAIDALSQMDPAALAERELGAAVADVAVGLAFMGGEKANKLFDVLTSTSEGIDVLYDLMMHRTSSKAGKRARDQLHRKEVIDRASPALRIALDLRAPGCDSKEALFDRAANEGDERALGLLWLMHSPQCSTKNGECCFKDSTKIEDAIRTLKSRTQGK